MFLLLQIFRQDSFEKSKRYSEKMRQALTNLFSFWRVETLRKKVSKKSTT
jgi:hypothetical protein